VSDQRRVVERDEATGPTLTETLDRLRAEDASVGEFVAAGGLSAFHPLTAYFVAEVRDGKPVQSFDREQIVDSLEDAITHAHALAGFARVGVFELVTKVVFE
jgi:hypothetical protein